jgi:hypothetical protein
MLEEFFKDNALQETTTMTEDSSSFPNGEYTINRDGYLVGADMILFAFLLVRLSSRNYQRFSDYLND